jgi:hypothetical protein
MRHLLSASSLAVDHHPSVIHPRRLNRSEVLQLSRSLELQYRLEEKIKKRDLNQQLLVEYKKQVQ